jgi:hypothetical protein
VDRDIAVIYCILPASKIKKITNTMSSNMIAVIILRGTFIRAATGQVTVVYYFSKNHFLISASSVWLVGIWVVSRSSKVAAVSPAAKAIRLSSAQRAMPCRRSVAISPIDS